MNAHDIRIYVFMKQGAYLYDAPKHELLPVLAGDFRSQIMMARPPQAGRCRPRGACRGNADTGSNRRGRPGNAASAPAAPVQSSRPDHPGLRWRTLYARRPREEVRMGRPRRRHRLAEHLAVLRRHRPEDLPQGLDGQGPDQGAAQAGRYPDHLPQPPRRLREIALKSFRRNCFCRSSRKKRR